LPWRLGFVLWPKGLLVSSQSFVSKFRPKDSFKVPGAVFVSYFPLPPWVWLLDLAFGFCPWVWLLPLGLALGFRLGLRFGIPPFGLRFGIWSMDKLFGLSPRIGQKLGDHGRGFRGRGRSLKGPGLSPRKRTPGSRLRGGEALGPGFERRAPKKRKGKKKDFLIRARTFLTPLSAPRPMSRPYEPPL
jgi:hypothetical protein